LLTQSPTRTETTMPRTILTKKESDAIENALLNVAKDIRDTLPTHDTRQTSDASIDAIRRAITRYVAESRLEK
jgi:hypothetical protein